MTTLSCSIYSEATSAPIDGLCVSSPSGPIAFGPDTGDTFYFESDFEPADAVAMSESDKIERSFDYQSSSADKMPGQTCPFFSTLMSCHQATNILMGVVFIILLVSLIMVAASLDKLDKLLIINRKSPPRQAASQIASSGSKLGSRGSQVSLGSRGSQVGSNGSRTGPNKSSTGSRHSSGGSQVGSHRPRSSAGSRTGSKVGSRTGSSTGSRTGSKTGSRTGSKSGSKKSRHSSNGSLSSSALRSVKSNADPPRRVGPNEEYEFKFTFP